MKWFKKLALIIALISVSNDSIYGQCEITELFAEAYCDSGNAQIDFEFESSIGCSGTFTFSVDDLDFGPFNYGQTFYTVAVPPEYTNITAGLVVEDDASDAIEDFSLFIPSCSSCNITDISATPQVCIGGSFTVELDFNYSDLPVGSTDFNVFVGVDEFGTFDYTALPVLVGSFVGNNTAFTLDIYDDSDDGCFTSVEVDAIDCTSSSCIISNLTPEALCDGDQAQMFVSFDYANNTNNFFEVYINGDYNSFYEFGATPTINLETSFENTTIDVQIVENDNPDCESDIYQLFIPACTAACAITDLVVESYCDGPVAVFDFEFNYSGNTNNFFDVLVNGDYAGFYEFGANSYSIFIAEALQNTVVDFQIAENDNPDCTSDIMSIEVLDCNNLLCSMDDVFVNISCDGDEAWGLLTFNASNPGAFGYTVQGNGTNYGTFYYEDDFPWVGPIDESLSVAEFVITDIEFPDCHGVFGSDDIPNCSGTADCSIFELDVELFCDGDDLFAQANFLYSDVGSTQFSVLGNGTDYGDYSYEDLPVDIGPINQELEVIELVFIDNETDGCSAEWVTDDIPNCGGSDDCLITELWFEPYCDGGTLYFDLGFEFNNNTNNFFEIWIDGDFYDFYSFAIVDGANYLTDELPAEYEGLLITVQVTENDNPDCESDVVTVELPSCDSGDDCSIFELDVELFCDGDGLYAEANFLYSNVGSTQFSVHGNGTDYGDFSYADLPHVIGPINQELEVIELVFIDNETDGCSAEWVTDDIPNCGGFDDCNYEVEFDVECGDETATIICTISSNEPESFVVTIINLLDGSITDYIVQDVLQVTWTELPFELFAIEIDIAGDDNCQSVYEINVNDECSDCSIWDLVFEPYCDGGSLWFDLDFNNEGTTNDYFEVWIDGDFFDYYEFSVVEGGDNYLTDELSSEFEGSVVTVQVTENDNLDCGTDIITVELPSCDSGDDCSIFELDVELFCDGDGLYAEANFLYSNVGSTQFSVHGNGTDYGDYSYEDLPVDIGPINQELEVIELVFIDNETDGCSAEWVTDDIPNCGGIDDCLITELWFEPYCDGGTLYFDLEFEFNNNTNNFFEIWIDGDFYDFYSFAIVDGANYLTDELPAEYEGLLITVQVTENDNPDCESDVVTVELPNCDSGTDCSIYELDVDLFCDSDGLYAEANFLYSNVGSTQFSVLGNGEDYGDFSYADLPHIIGPINQELEVIELLFFDNDIDGCMNEFVTDDIPDCGGGADCIIWDLWVESYCDGDDLYIDYGFFNEGTSNDFFNLYINGLYEDTDPFGNDYYTHLLGGDFEDQVITIQIVENDNEDCASELITFETESCPVEDCSIDAVIAEQYCDGGELYADINFIFSNTSGDGFTVQGNGTNYGNYSYSDVPVIIGPIDQTITILEFVVIDLAIDGCSDFTGGFAPLNCDTNCDNPEIDICLEGGSSIAVCPESCELDGQEYSIVEINPTGINQDLFVIDGECVTYSPLVSVDPYEETFNIVVCNMDFSICDTVTVIANVSDDCNTDYVWPGDANADGLTDNFDLLNIGLAYGYSGSARSQVSIEYVAWYAEDWNNSFANGVNHKHSDCNGNGETNLSDVNAIIENYGIPHPKGESDEQTSADDAPLYVNIPNETILAGTEFAFPVIFGTDQLIAENVYGMAFTVRYDGVIVEPETVGVNFDDCWLGQENIDLISVIQHYPSLNQFDVAISRVDHEGISVGFGNIGMMTGILIENVEGKGDQIEYDFSFEISDVKIITHEEELVPYSLITETGTVIDSAINFEPTENSDLYLYPNPSSDQLFVRGLTEGTQVTGYNIAGQQVLQMENVSEESTINVSGLPLGNYWFKFVLNDTVEVRRLIIAK